MFVTWHTLRRYFTGIDIATMRELGHPLDNYEYVVQNAHVLLKRLEDGSMPPPPFKRWPQNQIDDFQAWIDAGFPYQSHESSVPQKVRNFIGLSQALTGFDDLVEDPDQAAKNLRSIRAWTLEYSFEPIKPLECIPGKNPKYGNLDPVLDALLDRWDEIERNAKDKASGVADLQKIKDGLEELALEKLGEERRKDFVGVVKAIIRLWYTGSLPTTDALFKPPLSENQWADGLMWRAALAHPPGFSTEGSYKLSEVKINDKNDEDGDRIKEAHKAHSEKKEWYGHWTYKPEGNGKFTGLGNTATHFKVKDR